MERPDPHQFRERTVFSPEEERGLLLEGIAHLPDRVGYLWLKTRSAEAIKLSTARVELPEGEAFRKAVDRLRQDPTIGNRLSQAEYSADIASRDREWLGTSEESEAVEERWEKAYRRQEALCQE